MLDETRTNKTQTDSNDERPYASVRIGLMGIGLDAYWAQFPGLEERLRGYVELVALRAGGPRRTIVNLGLVDSADKATETAHTCRREDIDLLLVYATTYALSATVLPVVLRAKVPVLLLNLQPGDALDLHAVAAMDDRTAMTGEWLAWCGACPIPEIANVFARLGIWFAQITGTLQHDSAAWPELDAWLRAAEVRHRLAHTRLGLMGHYYGGMLDIATDLALVSGRWGVHLQMLEVEELAALRRDANPAAIAAKLQQFHDVFAIDATCAPAELDRAARTAVALDTLVAQQGLNALAYYAKGTGIAESEDALSSIIVGASLLTARGVPVAGEYEVKNALAMKVMDVLGAGGSFTEYYALDFADDVVLMGHDGPGHGAIAEGRIRVKPLAVYHGKVGSGLSVEMQVKHGPVTLLSVAEDRDQGFKLVVAEGESVPGPILPIGNTNSRYRFPCDAKAFAESWNAAGPAHHCAVGTGHIADVLQKLAALMQLGFKRIC